MGRLIPQAESVGLVPRSVSICGHGFCEWLVDTVAVRRDGGGEAPKE